MLFWANVTANCPISTWNRIGLVIEDTWHDFWILQAALLILAVCITFSALYCVYVCRQKYKMHRKEKQRREKLESQRKFEEEIIRKKSSKFANAEEGDSIFGEDNDFISQRSPRSDEYSNTNFVFEVDSKRKMSKFCHDVSKMDAGPEPEPKFSISPIITDEEKERAQTQNSDELDEENGQIQLVFQGETSCRPRRK
uniref:Uncharacterized protein n=1 Tax=Caenorhabditis japonica TaxID=281687 RepID=A0A8R1HXM9_CAEJA